MSNIALMLKNADLFCQACFVDNDYRFAKLGKTIDVYNPFDGTLIGTIPDLSSQEVAQAVISSSIAQVQWAAKTAFERADILHKWADLIEEHQDDLAIIITCEQGKPLSESLAEIGYSVSYFRYFADECRRVVGDILTADKHDVSYMVIKKPIGVCACITPWNFPMAMLARKVAPALAVGCSMLVKPDDKTPFSALALGVLAQQARLPSGVLQVVTGCAKAIGDVLTTHDKIAKFSFTGSTQVGKQLMAQCSSTVKKVSLELGGNAPFIVFDDANLHKAADGLIASKYRNAGQTCISANRIFVQDGVYDEFLNIYQQKVEQLVVGNGLDDTTDIGPLINKHALSKTQTLLTNALDNGATLLTGGKVSAVSPLCFMPTIIADVSDDMPIANSEIFAPISVIFRFFDEDEVIRRANNSPFGLACYFYTNDLKRSFRLAEQLDYGMIGQNTGLISTAVAPFGGIKQSGFGREGSKYGLDEYLVMKYWAVDVG